MRDAMGQDSHESHICTGIFFKNVNKLMKAFSENGVHTLINNYGDEF